MIILFCLARICSLDIKTLKVIGDLWLVERGMDLNFLTNIIQAKMQNLRFGKKLGAPFRSLNISLTLLFVRYLHEDRRTSMVILQQIMLC